VLFSPPAVTFDPPSWNPVIDRKPLSENVVAPV
jgi:hypothetical protein